MTTTVGIPVTPVVRKHPHAVCEGCPLYETGSYVPATFPTKPCSTGNRLAIVGEAPGDNEVRQGRPFIGPSGKILNGTLEILGLDRSEILVTNASACAYPKGRGPGEFDKLPAKAVLHCRPRLLHELQSAGVNTAVAMGAHAARSLLDTTEGISLVRAGGPKVSDYAPGVRVVATFHPAYALRSHDVFRFIIRDLHKIDDGVWNIWPGVTRRIVKSGDEAAQEIVTLWNSTRDPIVCDTESGADKDEIFGGGIKEVLCIGIWSERDRQAVIFPRFVFTDRVRHMMGKLFMRNGMDGQHIKYDIGRVLNWFFGVDRPIDIPVRGDRMLQHYVLCEVRGVHNLDYMSREYVGSPQWKHIIDKNMKANQAQAKAEAKARKEKIGKRYSGVDYSMVDDEVLWEYNSYDVGNTRYLRDYFDRRLENKPELRKLYKYLLDATQMLIHVEQRGIGIDEEYNLWLEGELRSKLDGLAFEDDLNPNSPDQVRRFLRSIGFEVESTRADVLKDIIRTQEITGERPEVADFCRTLLEHRGANKLLGTFVLGIRNAIIDGSIHPDFSLLTTTGRTRAKNPNPQNIPRRLGANLPSMAGVNLRKQFVARPGRIYVAGDYGQAELRTMAWLAKDPGLRDLFCSDVYVFDKIALLVFGSAKFDSWTAAQRKDIHGRLTKPLAYGSAYGRGPSAIAESFGISRREAKRIQGDFFAMIPRVVQYQRQVREIAAGCGDLTTPFGRRRRFRLVTDENIHEVYNEAMAFGPQSISSDICVTAAIRLDRMGVPIVNLVHDQIISEPGKGDAEECARLQRKVMIETAEEITEGYIPWKVDIEVGDSYGTFEKFESPIGDFSNG